jgi:hypothetical protein
MQVKGELQEELDGLQGHPETPFAAFEPVIHVVQTLPV